MSHPKRGKNMAVVKGNKLTLLRCINIKTSLLFKDHLFKVSSS